MSIKGLTIHLALLSIFAFGTRAHSADIGNKQDIPEVKTAQLTPKQVLNARRHFHVEVLSFDTSKRYGSKFPYSDYVKLRITNNSDVTLPYITPLTRRYSSGNPIGWSRAPVIAVHDLAPKRSKTIDYYPYGHLSVVPIEKLTVEIEATIDEEDMRLFKELTP
jgi:hypothetical protein